MEAVRDAYPYPGNISSSGEGNAAETSVNVWTYLDLQSLNEGVDNNDNKITKQTIALAEDPPHLNFAQRDDIADFYVVFVDLFLMSYAYCVVYGAGGFGRMGSLVSYNPRCGMPYTLNHGDFQRCDPFYDDPQ